MKSDSYLIWVDLEMSGLDPERHFILEIAAVITDNGLNIIDEAPDIAISHSEEALIPMEEWSRTHHELSGLLERVRGSTFTTAEAEQEILAFLSRYCEKGVSPLCGNSVWQDRRFLIRHMPGLEAFFHYRNIDVSSIKELVKRWYPALAPFKKEKAHLALSDIRESIDELKYYYKEVFKEAIQIPG